MTNTAEEDVELSDYLVMIKRNWLLTLIIFLVILGAALFYTYTTPKAYQARSMVMITTQDQTAYLLGGSFANLPRTDIQTQREIVLSGSVLSQVYSQPESYLFRINVEAIKDSNVLNIMVESENPATAMRIANKVAESYLNYTKETRKQEAKDVNAFIDEQIALYKTELDTLNLQLLQYRNKTNMTMQQQVTYQSLQQNIDAKEKLYNYLLSRAEEISIMAKESSGNVRIIEYATMPIIPIKPNIPLNIALGIIIALIASLGIVFIKESTRNTFKSIRAVEEELGHILGVVPKIRRGEYSSKDTAGANLFDFIKSPISGVRKGLNGNAKEYFLVDPDSEGPFAESIRMLRTNLLVLLKEKDIKLISVVSPQKSDGKTMITLNLGIELANAGKKVLVADANLRNPILGKALGIKDNEGITDVILEDAKLDKVIKKTDHKNLYLLPAGKHAGRMPSQILSADNVKELFAKLKASNLDVVLFDNTSLKYSECVMVTTHSQGSIFVVAHDKTNRDLAIKSKETLHKVKAHVIGVVINFFR